MLKKNKFIVVSNNCIKYEYLKIIKLSYEQFILSDSGVAEVNRYILVYQVYLFQWSVFTSILINII